MSDDSLLGRRLVAALAGPQLDSAAERALADLRPGGVCLFARNLASPAQVLELTGAIREVVGGRVFVAIDQEGGPVNRLAALDIRWRMLPAARVQARWDEEAFSAVWTAQAGALAALGIDVAFAPVVDLDASDGDNGVGERAFSDEPETATSRAGRVLDALAAAGVAGCLKHFPGLGGTDTDTHVAGAVSRASRDELSRRHLAPFRALASRADMVMVGHAAYPAIDGPDAGPATFSRRIAGGLLREEVGFRGLAISDDLEMHALDAVPPADRARRAIAAGLDLALYCREIDTARRARDVLAEAAHRDETLRARLAEAETRRLAWWGRRGAPAPPLPTREALARWESATSEVARICRREALALARRAAGISRRGPSR